IRRIIMRKLRLAVVATVMLVSGLAWATGEDTFVSTLKRFGIGPSSASKKPCFCHGGTYHDDIGLVTAYKDIASGAYVFDCSVMAYDAPGKITGAASCQAGGGTMTLVDK